MTLQGHLFDVQKLVYKEMTGKNHENKVRADNTRIPSLVDQNNQLTNLKIRVE